MKQRPSLVAGAPRFAQWSRSDLIDKTVAALIVVTIGSGAITLDRLIPWVPDGLWQVRTMGTLALLAVAASQFRRGLPPLGEAPWVLVPLIALCIYVAARAIPDLPGDRALEYLQHSALLVLQAGLLWWFVRSGEMATRVLAWLVALGLFLFLLALFGVGEPDKFGEGWGPIGSPTTFYRLEGIAAAAVLAMSGWVDRLPRWRALRVVLAGMLVYGALASVARVVPIALGFAVTWVGLGLAVKRNYRGVLVLVVSLMVVGAVFAGTGANLLQHRYSYGLAYQRKERPKDIKPNEDKKKRRRERQEVVSDRTDRLTMVYIALLLLREHPIVGAGPDAFVLQRRRAFPGDSNYYDYPHNILLEMLSMGGAIGGGLLMLAVAGSLVPALRAAGRNPYAMALGAYLPFAVVASMLSGDIYDFRLFWYVALLVPLVGMPGGRQE